MSKMKIARFVCVGHSMGDAKGMEAQIGTVLKDCDFDLFWKKWQFDIMIIKCPAILTHGQYDQDHSRATQQCGDEGLYAHHTIAGSSHTLVTGSAPDFLELSKIYIFETLII